MLFFGILFYFIFHKPTVDCGELLCSARQTGRLDHLSFIWQQQYCWYCRRLLLVDRGKCWFM